MKIYFFLCLVVIVGLVVQFVVCYIVYVGVIIYVYGGLVDQDDVDCGYIVFSGQFSYESMMFDFIVDLQMVDYKMGFWFFGMNVVFDGGVVSVFIGEIMDFFVINDVGGMD